MRRRLLTLGAALALSAAALAQPIVVRDDRGSEHRFAAPPQRIVTMLPSLTEAAWVLGVGTRLVGVDRYSNWPAQIAALPRLGGLEDAHIEAIAALQPDVVLASTSSRAMDRLEVLGLRVVRLKSDSHDDVRRTLQLVAQLLGRPEAGARVWGDIQRQLDAAAARVPPGFRGQRVYFDDGRIRGVVRGVSHGKAEVEITRAREEGDRLAPDKGINLPDTDIDVPALTDKDRADLAFAVTVADSIGLSFVRSPVDVILLQEALRMLGAEHLGIVLKIENRAAFGQLPELLLTAMRSRCAGLMIARGDLAVEIGYERLAEVQEEILWIAEAAHLPVIWATQVLEGLAKTGQPSRAEITDAAMGERAECVMLNKGPHITEAMRTLHDILRRMQAHQSKKRPLLRALRAWDPSEGEPQTAG